MEMVYLHSLEEQECKDFGITIIYKGCVVYITKTAITIRVTFICHKNQEKVSINGTIINKFKFNTKDNLVKTILMVLRL